MAVRRSEHEDPCAVDLAEYEQLRGEIDNRAQMANALVAVDLTALGIGLASIVSFSDGVIGIAGASAFLWMLWVDQATQVWKLAAYIAIELAPRLRESHPQALGWETFVRRLDKGGSRAREALRISDTTCSVPSLKTATVGLYSSLLMGGAPLALLGLSASALLEDMSGSARIARTLALLGSLVLWAAALHVYRRFRAFRSAIDLAIERSASFPESANAANCKERPFTDVDGENRSASIQEPTA